ncbi:MAG: c-type cytochrome [Myxococcales bacterium]|nr:c-type cytochrome [Myxococcales bacterium]MDP3500380.1 c-type cytochrome [Myxococcales bacterium]
MKNRLLAAALVLSMAASLACTPEAPGGGGNSASGSVAMSRDDSLVYAVDPDLDTLFVVDAKDPSSFKEVKVGRAPEKVLVAPDDTIYVANRYGRSLSVIRKGEAQVSATIGVGIEPVGLAVSTDGKTLYVVNSASRADLDVGTVMAIDTVTQQVKWEAPVGPEPRGITLLASGKAMVTLFKSGDIVLVDLAKGQVEKNGSDVFVQLNRSTLDGSSTGGFGGGFSSRSPFPGEQVGPRTRRPRGLEAITTNPEGTQVYVAALLSTDSLLNTRPNDTNPGTGGGTGFNDRFGGSSSGYGSTGACGVSSAVAAPALLTFDEKGAAQVDDLGLCDVSVTDRPPMLLTSNVPGIPVQGPTAIATDPSGAFVFIANRDSNNVSIIPTAGQGGRAVDPNAAFKRGGSVSSNQQVVNVGAGPTGLALARDGKTAWVFNAFDHSLSKLSSEGGIVRQTQLTVLGKDVLPANVVAGRKLFFSAIDARMTNPELGISCSTCHIEAREDGHIWNTTEGPRNTPSLIGKKLDETGPFHWNGEFATVSQFMTHTMRDRMGGQGPTTQMEQQLMAFIMSVPTPDNPFTTETPADVLARGKAAFDKAACSSCHSGDALTDNKFYDVGTLVTRGDVKDRTEFLFHGGLNTPSLLGIARTAPFLHDGSAPTLKARILIGKDANKHGQTSSLTNAEVDDLVSYVRSL